MLDFLRANVSADKLVWLTFAAALLCLPEFAVLGWVTHELVGFTVFGFLPAAILIALAVGLSAFASNECRRAARRVWFGVMLLAMAGMAYVAVAIQDPAAIKDAETVFAIVTLILTFPSGLIGPVILIGLERILSSSGAPDGSLLFDLVFWLAMVSVGYIQWFYAWPALLKAWLRKHSAAA
jgi:hypothetical protein